MLVRLLRRLLLVALLLVTLLLICPCGLLWGVLRGVLLLLRVIGLRLLLLAVGAVLLALGVALGHKLYVIGDDLNLGALLSFLLPRAVVELPLKRNLHALVHDVRKALSTLAEHDYVNEVRVILPLTSLRVLPSVVHSHAEVEDVRPALRLT